MAVVYQLEPSIEWSIHVSASNDGRGDAAGAPDKVYRWVVQRIQKIGV